MQAGRTFRVFVSSTFEDLTAERNALHESVFPRLRELCQRRGARFQAIDLRWGVSEEASLDQQTMNICLGEIERCRNVTPRPNFVVLLGQRYGWCPPPPQIPADEFEPIRARVSDLEDKTLLEGWYRRDDNAVPAEYRLQARERGTEYEKREAWEPIESRLQTILAAAARGMDFEEEQRRAYCASATEQEIAAGALRVSHPEGKVYCFFRTIEGARDENGNLFPGADRFIDADAAPIEALKDRLREKLEKIPDAVQEYTAEWDEENRQAKPAHLDQLAVNVYGALAGAIAAELHQPTEVAPPEEELHVEPDDMLDAEGRAHCDFANGLLRFFVGRGEPLRQIREYVEGEDRRPLAVVADGGAGKSALVAKALEEAKGEHPAAQIVYRFIGATPGSSDGRTLLRSLCLELGRRYGAEDELADDFRELVPEFGKRLGLATVERPLIVFLDALDQLSEAHGARGLSWLPDTLPAHVRLLVSTRREAETETFRSLDEKRPTKIELGPMSRKDGEQLLQLWLDDAGRTLQAAQREEVLDKFERSKGRPLYLRLAFEEARHWTGYDLQEELEPTIPGIIRKNLLDRLVHEEKHGKMLVSRALGYLAASRYGLAEDELLDVLSRDAEFYASFFKTTYHVPPDLLARAQEYRLSHDTSRVGGDGGSEPDPYRAAEKWLARLRTDTERAGELDRFLSKVLPGPGGPRLPVVLWSRLYFDLEPYLSERAAEGGPLLGFYHRELDDVASEEYLGDGRGCDRHGRLADYFRSRADPDGAGRWEGGDARGLSELPYHLARAARVDELKGTLTEFEFLYAKLAVLGPQPLIEDYDEARRAGYQAEDLKLVRDALRLSAPVIGGDSGQLAGHLLGRLAANDSGSIQKLLEQAMGWDGGPWLRPLKPSLASPGGPLQRILSGHTSRVRALAMTPDARYAVSGSEDQTLKVWDLVRGDELRTLRGHTGGIEAVAVTPDARHAVSGSWDKTLRVWDLECGESLRTLRGHTGGIEAVAVTPGARYAISGSEDNSLKLWDLERGSELLTLRGHMQTVTDVAITQDGRRAVSASGDKTLRVWDLEQGAELHALRGHTHWVVAVAVTADGRYAVSGSNDKTVKLWDLKRGEEVRTLTGHRGWVEAVALTADGRYAVSGSSDKTLILWDLERGEQLRTVIGHAGAVYAAAVTPDGRYAVSGSHDQTVRLWDLEAAEMPRAKLTHADWVGGVAVTSDGRYAVSGSHDGLLKIWDLEQGEELRTLKGNGAGVAALAVTPDGRNAISGCLDHTLNIWDLERMREPRTLAGHSDVVHAVAVTPDGLFVVSGSSDRTIKVWDSDSGEEVRTLRGHTRGIYSVALALGGRWVASGSHDNLIKIWDLERGQEVRTLRGHAGGVVALAVMPGGRYLVSGSADKTLRVWDVESGQDVRTLRGHSGGVYATAVTPDGRYVVSGSSDRTLKVWDVDSWQVIASFTAEGGLRCCAAVPDGVTVVAGEESGQVHLLRLEGIERGFD